MTAARWLLSFGGRNLVPLLLIALSLGCVSNKHHRIESIDRSPELYSVAFVELDDQGELWEPAQLDRATRLIEEANQHPDGAIVVLFIHGWNHNASAKDDEGQGNIVGFRNILQQIALRTPRGGGGSARPVVGIYVGWRGKTIRPKWLRPLSFFNRRGAALRVSGPASTELVYRVATTAKKNRAAKVVLIGHSFGGLILERAVTQAMIGTVLDSREGRGRDVPADVVILLNPASQAIYAKQFIEALDWEQVRLFRTTANGNRYERPLVVSITSKTDSATRIAFPTGLIARSLGKNFRAYRQESCVPLGRQTVFYRRTAGHSPVLRSHDVISSALRPQETLEHRFGSVRTELDPVTREPRFSFLGENHLFTIQRRPRAFNDSPYWILQVDSSLVPDHATVFGNDTVSLLGAIMAVTGALELESTTEFERLEGIAPIELVVRADNVPVVLDRDRRVYMPNPEGFLESPGCIPQEVDAADRIGLDFGPNDARATINTPRRGGENRGYRTEILSIQMTETGPVISGRLPIDSRQRFVAATFDHETSRVFLVSEEPGEVWRADLSRTNPAAKLAATFDVLHPLVAMALDAPGGRLFLSDGLSPTILGLGTRDFATSTVAEGAGWSVGLAYDSGSGILYSIDAEGKNVVARECSASNSCSAGRVVDLGGLVREPTAVGVGADGVLWVAGLFENIIVARRRDGRVEEIQTATARSQ